MAHFLEKTLSSLNLMLSSVSGSKQTRSDVPETLQGLFRQVISARTKTEEKYVVMKQLAQVEQLMSKPGVKTGVLKNCLLYTLFCNVLGYNTSFAYIHAAKLAQQGSLTEKMIGYLACSLFFHDQHELVTLLVNNILRDLSSANALEIALALTATAQFIPSELVPTLLPAVRDKLQHSSDYIRKKALSCVHYLLKKCPEQAHHLLHVSKTALSDKSPTVIAAALPVFEELSRITPDSLRDVVPGILHIQRQILQPSLPEDFQFQMIWAPWMQMTIMRLLRQLCKEETENAAELSAVLSETLEVSRRVDSNIAVAVCYECIVTVLELTPQPPVDLNVIFHYANQLLVSNNANLHYTGLDILHGLMQSNGVVFPNTFEEVVAQGLNHHDCTVQRKSAQLLIALASSDNIQVVCGHLYEYLRHQNSSDIIHAQLSKGVMDAAEKFVDDDIWLLGIFFKLLQIAVPDTANLVIQRIKLQIEKTDNPSVVNKTLLLCQKIVTSTSVSVQAKELCIWIMVKFHDRSTKPVSDAFVQLSKHQITKASPELCLSLISALQIVTKNNDNGLHIQAALEDLAKADDVNVQQRARECLSVLHFGTSIPANDDVMDFTLSFLDRHVVEALERGCRPFVPFQPVVTDWDVQGSPSLALSSSWGSGYGIGKAASEGLLVSRDETKGESNNFRVWTKEGRLTTDENLQSSLSIPEVEVQEITIENSCTKLEVKKISSQPWTDVDPLTQLLEDDLEGFGLHDS